ncbi:PucR family transcriptional regulator, partial [Actinomadura sp. 7K534]
IGVHSPCPTLDDVHESWQRARVAARVATPGETRDWNTLGALRLLRTAGDEALTQTTQTPGTTRLQAHPDLAETARTYLDLAGNIQQTAKTLNIHRQTLYHRLRRIDRRPLPLPDPRRRPRKLATRPSGSPRRHPRRNPRLEHPGRSP